MNVTEKLRGYSKFLEEGKFIGQNIWRGPCVIYGLFEWKKSAGHVLCKIVSSIEQWSHRYFLARYLPSNFIGKDGVRAKVKYNFFETTGRKNKRDTFTQLEPVV